MEQNIPRLESGAVHVWQIDLRRAAAPVIRVDGGVAAAICGIRFRDRIVILHTEFDPEYSQWHPVSVLLQYTIEHAIDEGATCLDFVRGQPGYENEILTSTEAVQVTAFRSTIGAAALRAQAFLRARGAR